jgi:hypothetical protein
MTGLPESFKCTVVGCPTLAGKHQAAMSSSMNNCGTKHRVMLPTSKLNSSDSQVLGAGIFLLPLQERVTPASFKNVMECY